MTSFPVDNDVIDADAAFDAMDTAAANAIDAIDTTTADPIDTAVTATAAIYSPVNLNIVSPVAHAVAAPPPGSAAFNYLVSEGLPLV